MATPRYAFFSDNHTQAEVRDFACNFDGEKYGDQLERCGVDFFTSPPGATGASPITTQASGHVTRP